MYAVIETGGKQYKVQKGDTLDVELVPAKKDKTIDFGNVLLVSKQGKIEVGSPYIKGAKVHAKLIEERKDDKVICFKYKNKTNYRRTKGHRQRYSRIQIEKIEA